MAAAVSATSIFEHFSLVLKFFFIRTQGATRFLNAGVPVWQSCLCYDYILFYMLAVKNFCNDFSRKNKSKANIREE